MGRGSAETFAPVMYWDSVFGADKTVCLAHATPWPRRHQAPLALERAA